MSDAKHQNHRGKRAGPWDSCDEESKADEDCLDECHTHHALCDGAHSRGAEAREAGPALLAGKALGTRAPRKASRQPPMLATKPSAVRASSPIFGCMLCTRVGRSSCAWLQTACSFLPMMGHAATVSGGAGICNVFC